MKYQFLIIALLSVGLFYGSASALLITNPTPTDWDSFGSGVSVVGDRILIGSWFDDGANDANPDFGSAYLYDVNGTLITQFDSPSATKFSYYSEQVAMNEDVIVINNSREPLTDGSVFVYNATDFSLITTINNPNNGNNANFGEYDLNVHDGVIAIPCFNCPVAGGASGRAFLYDYQGNELAHWNSTQVSPTSHFGRSMDVSDDGIVVGATNIPISGHGTVYHYNATDYSLIRTYQTPVAEVGFFGISTEIHNGKILIGGSYTNSSKGMAFLYDAVTGTSLYNYTNPRNTVGNDFAHDVSMNDDYVLIGAPYEDAVLEDSGSAYLFDYNGNLIRTIDNPHPVDTDEEFAYYVDLGSKIAIGNYQDHDPVAGAGSVLLLDLPTVRQLNNQASCEAVPFSGSWNNGVCTITNSEFDEGDTIVINQGVNMIIEGSLTNNAVITNNGIITNYGDITGADAITNNAKMTNKCNGTLDADPQGSDYTTIRCGGSSSGSTTSGVNSNIPQLSDIPQVTSTESLGVPQKESSSVEDLFASLFSNPVGENIETPTQSFTSQPSSSSGSSSSVSSSPVANFFQNLFASWFS